MRLTITVAWIALGFATLVKLAQQQAEVSPLHTFHTLLSLFQNTIKKKKRHARDSQRLIEVGCALKANINHKNTK